MKPILYGDIFEFPLTFEEIYRYLEIKSTEEEVRTALDQAVDNQVVLLVDGYYSLPNRPHLAAKRRERQETSRLLWSDAIQYGRWIASLPFVRFIAVTGSLAVDNPRGGVDDIDYLIVTRSQRLWLCRAMIILLVKYSLRQGVYLCPNYLITEKVLNFDNNLFTAREMLQMKPLYGRELYLKIRELNAWVADHFPQGNDLSLEKLADELSLRQYLFKRFGEFILGGFVGNLIEKWMQRVQMTKHSRRAEQVGAADKVVFSPDVCKGHYDGHSRKTIAAYQRRIKDRAVNLNKPSPNGKVRDLTATQEDSSPVRGT